MALNFDPEAERRAALADAGELERLAASVDPANAASILNFGAEATRGIARTADELLHGMDRDRGEDPGGLLEALAGVMERVDMPKDAPKPGFFERLRGGGRAPEVDLTARYEVLGGELDRVYVGLKAYEARLERDNRRLDALFQANLRDYRDLERHVAAAEQARRALAGRLARCEASMGDGGGAAAFEVQTLRSALSALERRIVDLRSAEVVALQSLPMIRTLQMNNRELAERIDTAFIVTLPAFRMALGEAVRQRRQRLRGEAMDALRIRSAAGGPDGGLEASRRRIAEDVARVRDLRQRAEDAQRQAGERLRDAVGTSH